MRHLPARAGRGHAHVKPLVLAPVTLEVPLVVGVLLDVSALVVNLAVPAPDRGMYMS